MAKALLVTGVVLFLSACGQYPDWQPNQTVRKELFMQCLDRLPKSPQVIGQSGDWEGVVSQCQKAAYYMSLEDKNLKKGD